MPNATTIALYFAGTLNAPQPDEYQKRRIEQTLEQLSGSGITRLILFTLNPTQCCPVGGDFSFGSTPIIRNGSYNQNLDPDLPQLLAKLKATGGVQEVFFTIGGAGSDETYNAFGELFAKYGVGPKNPLYGSLGALAKAFDLDGFDLDLEPSDSSLVGTMVDMADLIAQLGLKVTYAPYENHSFWVECLQKTYQKLQKQPVVAWNLQCYAGGLGNQPSDWVAAIKEAGASTGVDDPAGFVLPGYETLGTAAGPCCVPDPSSNVFSPKELAQKFSELKTSDPGINGGFLWQYGRILDTQVACDPPGPGPKDYADAINAGISGGDTGDPNVSSRWR